MSSAANEGERSFTITPDDHGGVIIVVGCVLMTWTLLCFMIRLYNRFAMRSSLGLDDFVCGVATVFAIPEQQMSGYESNAGQVVGVAQTLLMCVAVSHGFGKSAVLETHGQIHTGEKASPDVHASTMSLC
jgi:hypothetical protein